MESKKKKPNWPKILAYIGGIIMFIPTLLSGFNIIPISEFNFAALTTFGIIVLVGSISYDVGKTANNSN